MNPLSGQVALVTGASRGIGRGIAVGLGEAGATVVVTGRTRGDDETAASGTLAETAAMVTARGGQGVAMQCDHRDDAAVADVFEAVERDRGRLDVLVNNVTALPDLEFLFSGTPFWKVPCSIWDDLFDVGLRSHFVATQLAAPMMIQRGRGLIVNVSSAGAQAKKFAVLPYGVAKAALDRMTADMAAELEGHGVTVVSLWPPATRTESMLAQAGHDDDISTWSEPVFTGRVVAALAAQPKLATTGSALVARTVAAELGIEDTRNADD